MESVREFLLKAGLEAYVNIFLGEDDHYLFLLNKTKIYESKGPNFINVEEGIKKVHEGGFAYHTETVSAYPIIAKTFETESICELAEIGLITTDTSLMLQKKSQYKKLFQISLRKMWTSGIMKKLYKTWVAGKPECQSSARLISVGLNDLFLLYFLLTMGVLVSLLILIFEIIWEKIRKRYEQGKQQILEIGAHIPYIN